MENIYDASNTCSHETVLLPHASDMQVHIKRVLGILSAAHGTAGLTRGHPALIKPHISRTCGDHLGKKHLLLDDDVQIQGETADEQLLDEPWFGQVGHQPSLMSTKMA